ncbi:MAG: HD domain-containing phosphohydrolase [Candidatus Omnitrophota bacterium]
MISREEILKSKILIIDDQKLQTHFLVKLFEQEGYHSVECVTDPQKAIETCHHFQPDAIVLNLIMRQVDGFQVMNSLEEYRKDNYLPVLCLSEDKNPDIRQRALQSGATDFLTKPYESIEILMRIHNMVITRILHLQVKNQNKMLESRVHERTKELNETRLDIIRRLAHAAECRDDDTGKHIIRMSQYCEKLARALGLSDEQCELILNASPLHDIGKIGIPDSILRKPGKLSAEEYEFMKQHTTIGAKLLAGSNSGIMKMAEIIALTHQEKWDGTGYPQGLKGDKIPLVGQICSVCDVFDALTSKRPYKEAWSNPDALAEIEKGSGKHFNPKLVETFKRIFPEIEKIKEQHADE